MYRCCGREGLAVWPSTDRPLPLSRKQQSKAGAVSALTWRLSWRIGTLCWAHVVQQTAPEALLRRSRVSVAGRMILGPWNNGMSDARISRRFCTAFHVHDQRILEAHVMCSFLFLLSFLGGALYLRWFCTGGVWPFGVLSGVGCHCDT